MSTTEPDRYPVRLGAMAQYIVAAHRMIHEESVGLYLVDWEDEEGRFASQSFHEYIEQVTIPEGTDDANEELALLAKVIDANVLRISCQSLIETVTMNANYLVWISNAIAVNEAGREEELSGLHATVWDRQSRREWAVINWGVAGVPVAVRSDFCGTPGPSLPELAHISNLLHAGMGKLTLDMERVSADPDAELDGPEQYVKDLRDIGRTHRLARIMNPD